MLYYDSMLKHYDFECHSCQHVFDEYVEGSEGQPESCPKCSSVVGFKKLISTCALPTTIIIDYPGSKALKAGYAHLFNKPAEKAGRQISMSGTGGLKKKV